MKTKTILNIAAVGSLMILVLLTVCVKYEEATRDTWDEAQALRIKQDCMAEGGTWVIRPPYTDNQGRYYERREWCDAGHIGIPTK